MIDTFHIQVRVLIGPIFNTKWTPSKNFEVSLVVGPVKCCSEQHMQSSPSLFLSVGSPLIAGGEAFCTHHCCGHWLLQEFTCNMADSWRAHTPWWQSAHVPSTHQVPGQVLWFVQHQLSTKSSSEQCVHGSCTFP